MQQKMKKIKKKINEDTFVGHLEELRSRVIIILISVLIGTILAYINVDEILKFLINSVNKLVFIKPAEALFTKLKISLFIGIFCASPIILYQIWEFISPALYDKEKKHLYWFIFFSCLLFIAGCGFAYFLVYPISIKFLLGMGNANIQPLITISSYMDFLIIFCLTFGIIFQLPLVILLLTKLEIITPQWLINGRKYIILIIFILAAFITPGPDIFSQFMMAIPTLILFEISIIIAKLVYKK